MRESRAHTEKSLVRLRGEGSKGEKERQVERIVGERVRRAGKRKPLERVEREERQGRGQTAKREERRKKKNRKKKKVSPPKNVKQAIVTFMQAQLTCQAMSAVWRVTPPRTDERCFLLGKDSGTTLYTLQIGAFGIHRYKNGTATSDGHGQAS